MPLMVDRLLNDGDGFLYWPGNDKSKVASAYNEIPDLHDREAVRSIPYKDLEAIAQKFEKCVADFNALLATHPSPTDEEKFKIPLGEAIESFKDEMTLWVSRAFVEKQPPPVRKVTNRYVLDAVIVYKEGADAFWAANANAADDKLSGKKRSRSKDTPQEESTQRVNPEDDAPNAEDVAPPLQRTP